MPRDPLKLAQRIRESYRRYLTSVFRLRDQELRDEFLRAVDAFPFSKGPLLEAALAYKEGCRIQELADEGILHEATPRLTAAMFDDTGGSRVQTNPLHALHVNRLHLHQEKALRKLLSGRNIVIASGTGSGKTECFLLPIYDYLLREQTGGTLGPGVRALLLYPMNALVNDQLRRLRAIDRVLREQLPGVNITFGRYTGETVDDAGPARDKFCRENPGVEPAQGEVLSRSQMQSSPPHILITNYAMLEYLLLRPKDSVFFDGEAARHWKFIVLDEAHSYTGASGIEMGMLLRRLKDRVCEGKTGVLRCIATSATLAGEESDYHYRRVADFAKLLFGEEFEWTPDDQHRQDVVFGERVSAASLPEATLGLRPTLFSALDQAIRTAGTPEMSLDVLTRSCSQHGVTDDAIEEIRQTAADDARRFLYALLARDRTVGLLRQKLENDPATLEDLTLQVLPGESSDSAVQQLASLVNLTVWAQPDAEKPPLLPARYHMFVRAPEGVFATLGPRRRIYLSRAERDKDGQPVFELGSCRRCGQEYLVGYVDGDKKLRQMSERTETPRPRKRRYFLLLQADQCVEEDEDASVAAGEESSKAGAKWRLCARCGVLRKEGRQVAACMCGPGEAAERTLLEVNSNGEELNKCLSCGLQSTNIVREFVLQADAPAAVLATALFQSAEGADPKRRKILVFSDSRQDAAFFAPYLSGTHERIVYRRLMVSAMAETTAQTDYRLQSLCDDTLRLAEKENLLGPELGGPERKKLVWSWVLQEFCALDRRNCLEGVGLLGFRPIPPDDWTPAQELTQEPWDLSTDEARQVYTILLNTLRLNKAVSFPPDGPPADDEAFARFHRDRRYTFRGSGADVRSGIYAFNPAQKHLNSRLEYLQKLFTRVTKSDDADGECRRLLGRIWMDLAGSWVQAGRIVQSTVRTHGMLSQLDHRFWRVVNEKGGAPWYVCDACGTITSVNVRGVCPTFGCSGTLSAINSSQRRDEVLGNHYRGLYLEQGLSRMVADEHTAQLKADDAASVQQQFVDGRVNVLSCSTTFELGVDLGELETIFLRNVPPEPSNYIQRSGRAGRRTDSVGFTLTFAQLRSHDLSYYREPERLVAGRIHPPAFEIENEKIVRRHLHSVALAAFFRQNPEYYGTVNSFFHMDGSAQAGPDALAAFLGARPQSLLDSMRRVAPGQLHDTLGLNDWSWITELLEEPNGALWRANLMLTDEFNMLSEFYRNREQEWIAAQGKQQQRDKLNADMRWADSRKQTIRERNLLEFLASQTVLPKYGFPVDLVKLQILRDSGAARKIELDRDLRIAIAEYAPSSEVVAKGKVWQSAGLRVVRDRAWPIRWYSVCPQCGRFNIRDGTIADSEPPGVTCSGCNQAASRNDVRRFVVPIFGFVTGKDVQERAPGESRPKKEFTTRPYFIRHADPQITSCDIGGLHVSCEYSRHGELAVVCKGRKGEGFCICFTCGAACPGRPRENSHTSPLGDRCQGTRHSRLHLGHTFKTDVLVLRLSPLPSQPDEDFYLSLLYALLEGASRALGIRRRDLDGALFPQAGSHAIVLYDDVPGGAGHVKRIAEPANLTEVFKAAFAHLRDCECGPETSCVDCLRNYQNQFCHDMLKRGIVADFLAQFLPSAA